MKPVAPAKFKKTYPTIPRTSSPGQRCQRQGWLAGHSAERNREQADPTCSTAAPSAASIAIECRRIIGRIRVVTPVAIALRFILS